MILLPGEHDRDTLIEVRGYSKGIAGCIIILNIILNLFLLCKL